MDQNKADKRLRTRRHVDYVPKSIGRFINALLVRHNYKHPELSTDHQRLRDDDELGDAQKSLQ